MKVCGCLLLFQLNTVQHDIQKTAFAPTIQRTVVYPIESHSDIFFRQWWQSQAQLHTKTNFRLLLGIIKRLHVTWNYQVQKYSRPCSQAEQDPDSSHVEVGLAICAILLQILLHLSTLFNNYRVLLDLLELLDQPRSNVSCEKKVWPVKKNYKDLFQHYGRLNDKCVRSIAKNFSFYQLISLLKWTDACLAGPHTAMAQYSRLWNSLDNRSVISSHMDKPRCSGNTEYCFVVSPCLF